MNPILFYLHNSLFLCNTILILIAKKIPPGNMWKLKSRTLHNHNRIWVHSTKNYQDNVKFKYQIGIGKFLWSLKHDVENNLYLGTGSLLHTDVDDVNSSIIKFTLLQRQSRSGIGKLYDAQCGQAYSTKALHDSPVISIKSVIRHYNMLLQ